MNPLAKIFPIFSKPPTERENPLSNQDRKIAKIVLTVFAVLVIPFALFLINGSRTSYSFLTIEAGLAMYLLHHKTKKVIPPPNVAKPTVQFTIEEIKHLFQKDRIENMQDHKCICESTFDAVKFLPHLIKQDIELIDQIVSYFIINKEKFLQLLDQKNTTLRIRRFFLLISTSQESEDFKATMTAKHMLK